jgi:hypothetical protein
MLLQSDGLTLLGLRGRVGSTATMRRHTTGSGCQDPCQSDALACVSVCIDIPTFINFTFDHGHSTLQYCYCI